ncbi:hypothetical protein HC256_003235 [Beauveria bassiana]|nr:hypothetical protein HC256_003235 [Beauveria bassiana]
MSSMEASQSDSRRFWSVRPSLVRRYSLLVINLPNFGILAPSATSIIVAAPLSRPPRRVAPHGFLALFPDSTAIFFTVRPGVLLKAPVRIARDQAIQTRASVEAHYAVERKILEETELAIPYCQQYPPPRHGDPDRETRRSEEDVNSNFTMGKFPNVDGLLGG